MCIAGGDFKKETYVIVESVSSIICMVACREETLEYVIVTYVYGVQCDSCNLIVNAFPMGPSLIFHLKSCKWMEPPCIMEGCQLYSESFMVDI